VARVDVTFLSGQAPVGDMEGPSSALAADKVNSGPIASAAGSAKRGRPPKRPSPDR
jgi:hypothetical protein